MKKVVLHSLLLLAAFAACARADVTVSLASEGVVGEASYVPFGRVFASTEKCRTASGAPVDHAMGWRWDDAARREIAQSFRTGSKEVSFDKITFKTGGAFLSKALQDNAKAVFRLSIYRLPSPKALPSDVEAELISDQTGSFAGFAEDRALKSGNIIDTSYNYISFAFKPVALDPGSYYAVVLSFAQGAPGYAIPMAQNDDNHDTYTDGSGAVLEDGGTWAGTSDFYFYAESVNDQSGH